MAIVTALCVCLSVMLITPFAATQIQEEQSSHQQAANDKIEFSVPTLLPRKLRLVDQEVKSYAAQGLTSLNKPKGDSTPGKPYRREQNEVYGGDQPGNGVDGSRGPTHTILSQWIMRPLEEDVQYTTNPRRLVHKTWRGRRR
ncbi:root meristem growth factor [Salix suchowensis]|nr:root meristem growth factor [Salix suchowensis]